MLFGPIDLTRSRCQDGSYPLDRALGLNGRQPWSVGVQEAASLLSFENSFATVSELMKRLLDVCISPARVQQVSQLAGERAGEEMESTPAAAVSQPAPARGQTLVLATDGCQAPQRDGWHEVKVAPVYTHESRTSRHRRAELLQKEYLAPLENVEGFGRRLWKCAEGWGVQQAGRVVCMGVGRHGSGTWRRSISRALWRS